MVTRPVPEQALAMLRPRATVVVGPNEPPLPTADEVTKLVRDASDRPGIAELRRSVPKVITKVVPVGRAGTAIADGVAERATRVAAPRWMRLMLPLRGLIQYFDGRMVKDRNVRSAINAAENAKHG